jgi:hypothetical protein
VSVVRAGLPAMADHPVWAMYAADRAVIVVACLPEARTREQALRRFTQIRFCGESRRECVA